MLLSKIKKLHVVSLNFKSVLYIILYNNRFTKIASKANFKTPFVYFRRQIFHLFFF